MNTVESDIFFNEAATAQMSIDPRADRVVSVNQQLTQLLNTDASVLLLSRVSELFVPSFAQLIVFTQEILHSGAAWCDHLMIAGPDEALRVEVTGRCSTVAGKLLVHLTLLDAEQMVVLRQQSDAQHHYQCGLGHWKRASRVFQEFERDNQLLLEAAGEGIYGVDVQGNTTFINPMAERILGYTVTELQGRNIHDTVHYSHEDGSDFCVEQCPIFTGIRDGQVHVVEDDVFWNKRGEPVNVEYSSTPVRDNGVIIGAVVIFRDISQKKADKKRLLDALSEVEKLKNRLELENAYLQEEINQEFNHHQIIGKSAPVQAIIQQINQVAPTDATVLVNGESGTGKELVARAIHELSQRSSRPLIRVNCAAIPAELFESEFFGHAKGAFTGANIDRPGRFELADGGTLFLDEVGEIPLHLQGKLLRVLQEQQFERVGESKTRLVDVRIIAATNRDLKRQAERGLFREDLYFRLNVFPIVSPPLRQRIEDIPMLTQHFLNKISTRINKVGLKIPMAELAKLTSYHWPGNIRELENVIERQVIVASDELLRFDSLSELPTPAMTRAPASTDDRILTGPELKAQERRSIILALKKCQGKVSGTGGAAELLALNPTTLASRIKKLNIDIREFKMLRRSAP